MTELSVISISILLISIVSFFFSPLKNYVRVFYTSVYYYGLETFSYSSESTASSRGEPLFSSLLFSATFFSSEGNETRRTNGSSRKQNSESRRVALLINYKRRRAAARETNV